MSPYIAFGNPDGRIYQVGRQYCNHDSSKKRLLKDQHGNGQKILYLCMRIYKYTDTFSSVQLQYRKAEHEFVLKNIYA